MPNIIIIISPFFLKVLSKAIRQEKDTKYKFSKEEEKDYYIHILWLSP